MKLEAQIRQLENAQLVRRSDDPDPAYSFKHTLTQETAYESMLLKKRREIHLRVAQAYEELHADRLDEFAAVLAQHYAEAGDDAKTLEYATRAGDAAAQMYASAEAVEHYRRALDIAKREEGQAPLSRLIHLYMRLGRMLELGGQYEEAIRHYQEMERVARERAEPRLELESLLARATLYVTPTRVFNAREGQALSDRALRLARELNDHAAEARLLWNLELLNWFTSRPEQSLRYGEQSVALARQFNLREQLAFSLSDLNFTYFTLGQTEKAQAVLEEGYALWQELDNKPMLANSLAALAENSYLLGEFEQSLAQGAEALRISQAIDNLWGQSYSQMLAGNVYWERGNPAQAIQTMNGCILLAEQAGFTVPQFLTRADLGLIYASLGAVEHGLELVRKGHEVAKRSVVFTDWALAYLARVLIQKGSLREAGEILEEAGSRFPRGHLGNVFPIVAFSLLIPQIELAISRRDVARAASLADTLIEFLEKGKMRAFLPEALYLSGRAALAQGEAEQARLRLDEARAAAEALGSRRMQWQILAALGDIESGRGNHAEAEAFRKQASVIVEYIADHTPKDLKASFLNLPDVRALRQADPQSGPVPI